MLITESEPLRSGEYPHPVKTAPPYQEYSAAHQGRGNWGHSGVEGRRGGSASRGTSSSVPNPQSLLRTALVAAQMTNSSDLIKKMMGILAAPAPTTTDDLITELVKMRGLIPTKTQNPQFNQQASLLQQQFSIMIDYLQRQTNIPSQVSLGQREGKYAGVDVGRVQYESTRLLELAPSFYSKIKNTFKDFITNIVDDYFNGVLNAYDFGEKVKSTVEELYPLAYIAGMKAQGGSELDFDAEQQAFVRSLIMDKEDGEFKYIANLIQNMNQTTMTKLDLLDRMNLYLNSLDEAFSLGAVSVSHNNMLTFKLGPTEEHCKTCSRLNGKRHKAVWWESHGYIPGQPGNENFECEGYKCQCRLIDDKGKPVTESLREGGPGSGNFGHADVAGRRGGSAPTNSVVPPEISHLVKPADNIEPYNSRYIISPDGNLWELTGNTIHPAVFSALFDTLPDRPKKVNWFDRGYVRVEVRSGEVSFDYSSKSSDSASWIRSYISKSSGINKFFLSDIPNGHSVEFTSKKAALAHLDTMIESLREGGSGSGFFGHKDVTGRRGGSAPSGTDKYPDFINQMDVPVVNASWSVGSDGRVIISLERARSHDILMKQWGASDSVVRGIVGTSTDGVKFLAYYDTGGQFVEVGTSSREQFWQHSSAILDAVNERFGLKNDLPIYSSSFTGEWAGKFERDKGLKESLREGGSGSGYFNHPSVKGRRGGSAPSGKSEIEKQLHDGNVITREPIGRGMNRPDMVTLDNGIKAVEKVQRLDNSQNEVFAYKLSETLGLDVVPSTVMIKISEPDTPYALGTTRQLLIDGENLAQKELSSNLAYPDLYKDIASHKGALEMYLLDNIDRNLDRSSNNMMIDKQGRIWAIDNGILSGFPVEGMGRNTTGLERYLRGQELPQDYRTRIQDLVDHSMDPKYADLRNSTTPYFYQNALDEMKKILHNKTIGEGYD